jgi:hypothetical protein
MALVLILLVLMAPAPAAAAPIYDGSGTSTLASGQNPGSASGANFLFSEPVRVRQFSVFRDLEQPGNFNFLIFEGLDLAYESGPVAVAPAGGFAEYLSPVIDFTFEPGISYGVGAIGDVASQQYLFFIPGGGASRTENGITNVQANANFSGFESPERIGNGFARVPASLYDAPVSAVPAPPGFALLAGAAGLLLLRRRRGA